MNKLMISKKNEFENAIGIEGRLLRQNIGKYISLIDNFPPGIIKYHHQSDAQVDFYRFFKETFGADKIPVFHKIIMLELMIGFPARVKNIKIPSSIMKMFSFEFERIFNSISNDKGFIFDWSNDLFAKDMGICTFRLLPVGPGLIEVSGFSRRVLFNELSKIIPNLWFFIFKAKGSKPFYEIHTHLANVSEFNPDGWLRCYVRIAELLQMNPEMKGFQRSSWLVDPALSEISPRLEYLRIVPSANGAKIFFVKKEDESCGALSKSETRKMLYHEGKYIPRAFLLLWPRKEMINYVNENNKNPCIN